MYKWLTFARRILLVCLINDPDTRITVPTLEEVRKYQKAIGEKYHLVGNVWGAANGLNLCVERSGNYDAQHVLIAGRHTVILWTMFFFACDGKIWIGLQNCPGILHDSTMSDYGVYCKMEEIYCRVGGKVVVDSVIKNPNDECLIKSFQTDLLNARTLLISRQAISVRRLSEWGMRMIEG